MAIQNDKTQAQKPQQAQPTQPAGQNWQAQQGQKPAQEQPGQAAQKPNIGQSAQVNSNKSTQMDTPFQKK